MISQAWSPYIREGHLAKTAEPNRPIAPNDKPLPDCRRNERMANVVKGFRVVPGCRKSTSVCYDPDQVNRKRKQETGGWGEAERERERERERETERETERQRDRETDKQTDRQTDRKTEKQTDGEKREGQKDQQGRQREIDRLIEREGGGDGGRERGGGRDGGREEEDRRGKQGDKERETGCKTDRPIRTINKDIHLNTYIFPVSYNRANPQLDCK